MSTDIDFKALWNREQTGPPDLSEIFAKANRMTRCSRRRIWICNICLSLTIALYILIWGHYQPQLITTKIGLTLMIGAMVMFVIASNQIYPLLTKADLETDTNAFLLQMIRIKHKQDFLNRTIMVLYFIMLSVGLGLYYIEYVSRGKLFFQVCTYSVTLTLLALNWFYIHTPSVKKQGAVINDIIAKLEAVNKQLGE